MAIPVECPICRRGIRLITGPDPVFGKIPAHRDARTHRRCKGSEETYALLVRRLAGEPEKEPSVA